MSIISAFMLLIFFGLGIITAFVADSWFISEDNDLDDLLKKGK